MTLPRWAQGAILVGVILLIGVAVFATRPSEPPGGPDVPDLAPYVNDFANPPVLTPGEIDELDAMSQDLDDFTTAEFAVLIVNTTQPWGIERYAVDTFAANGIGKAGKDNGLLLVISVDEHAWRIEVGYGLEGVLPDSKVGQIGRDYLVPNLAAGDYFTGIQTTMTQVNDIVSRDYDPGAPINRPSPLASLCFPVFLVLMILTVGIVVVVFWYAKRHPEILTRSRTSSGGGSDTTSVRSQPPLNFGNSSSGKQFGGGRSGGGGAGGRY